MITEFALFRLGTGSGSAFVAAIADVAPLLTGVDAYIRHRLVPALESADFYLLAVDWRDVTTHTQGFKPGEAHARFMASLGPLLSGYLIVHVEPGRSRDIRRQHFIADGDE